MSGSSAVNRWPPGSARGGQFAETPKPGAEVSLLDLSDAEYNARGTYLFPPRPRTVSQHIAFWENVPIPDEIMANVQQAYQEHREEAITAACNRAAEEWKIANPDPTAAGAPRLKGKDYYRVVQGWKNGIDKVWFATEAREQDERPEQIPIFEMRSVLRAHHMAMHGPAGLTDQEVNQVLEHQLPWGAGAHATVAAINVRYRLQEIDEQTRTPLRCVRVVPDLDPPR